MTIRASVCIFLLSLVVPCVIGAQSSARSKGIPSELTVRFEGGLAASNYATVLVALGEAGLLRFEVYSNPKGLMPVQFMRNGGHLPVGTVAPELDRYLCKINSHICELTKAGQTFWKNQKATVRERFSQYSIVQSSLWAPMPCPSSSLPSHLLCLPVTTSSKYQSFTEIKYTAGVDAPLSQIVTARTGGCETFDAACQRLLKEFNPGTDPLSPKFSGTLLVPVESYGVTMPVLAEDHFQSVKSTLDGVIGRLTRSGQQTEEAPRVFYTVPFSATKNGGAPQVADSRDTLGQMEYPYSTDVEFRSAKLQPVIVGVWDFAVDGSHCDYQEAMGANRALVQVDNIPFDANRDPNLPTKAAACDGVREPLSDRWDHGTFVTGILAARLNGFGVAGAHPGARVWTFEATGQRLRNDPIPELARAHGAPAVINISLSDAQVSAPSDLDAIIKRYRRSTLFVAAAGNGGREFKLGDTCLVLPACSSQSADLGASLISVVALAGDNLLTGANATNYGTAFDVAAPGKARSTLYGDSFGTMEGTSVAAPFVTGLAALIKSKAVANTVTPTMLKHRILYTADFSVSFDRVVRFGKINFKRALDIADDVIEIKKDDIFPGFVATRRISKEPDDVVVVTDGIQDGIKVSPLPKSIPVASLRRISYDKEQDRYWVVYVERVGDRDVLRKIRGAQFANDARLRYADAAQPTHARIATIQNYTCALECQEN